MDKLARRVPSDGVAEVASVDNIEWDIDTGVFIAGGGGTGLVAAPVASGNPDVCMAVLGRTPECGGNTPLSAGMIPAAGVRLQCEVSIEEVPVDITRGILEKNDYETDEERVQYLCEESMNLIHQLVDDWDIMFHIVDDFKYPKHSEYRMHAPEGRNGENLVAELVERVESTPNIELLTNAPMKRLIAEDSAVRGIATGLGHDKTIEAEKAILATDGFAGNRKMATDYCKEGAERTLYFGADGNTGDGVRFDAEFGSELAYMDAYQGHTTAASQTGALSIYAVTMNGGILVNRDGKRFDDESVGYSEFAISVLKRSGEQTTQLFSGCIFEKLRGQSEDFDDTIERGTYRTIDSAAAPAERLGAGGEAVTEAVAAYNEATAAGELDEVGRIDGVSPLEAPFYGVKVTDVLFHIQDDLVVDEHGRVLRTGGSTVENLYAGDGTACDISGHEAGGYLSDNGLTTTLGCGHLAGIRVCESLD